MDSLSNEARLAFETAKSKAKSFYLGIIFISFLGFLAAGGYLIYIYQDIKNNGPRCDGTPECEEGLYCVDGNCKGVCTNDNQCEGTQKCLNGKCANPDDPETDCQLSADCGFLQVCDNGTCLKKKCDNDSQCGVDGYFCDSGTCKKGVLSLGLPVAYFLLITAAVVFVVAILCLFVRSASRFISNSRFMKGAALALFIIGVILIAVYLNIVTGKDYVVAKSGFQDSFILLAGLSCIVISIVIFTIRSYGSSVYIDRALEEEKDFEEVYENANDTQKKRLKEAWLTREEEGSEEDYARLNSYVSYLKNPGLFGGLFFGKNEDEAYAGLDDSNGSGDRRFDNRFYTRGDHLATLDQYNRGIEPDSRTARFQQRFINAFQTSPDFNNTKREEIRQYKQTRDANRERIFR